MNEALSFSRITIAVKATSSLKIHRLFWCFIGLISNARSASLVISPNFPKPNRRLISNRGRVEVALQPGLQGKAMSFAIGPNWNRNGNSRKPNIPVNKSPSRRFGEATSCLRPASNSGKVAQTAFMIDFGTLDSPINRGKSSVFRPESLMLARIKTPIPGTHRFFGFTSAL